MEGFKICNVCKIKKPISEFYNNKHGKCKKCFCKHVIENNHIKGKTKPYGEAKGSPLYLGVYVAERVLAKVFKNVKRAHMQNPGYDFICGKGFKIDVKSACLSKKDYPSWNFRIRQNKIADYFLLLAFDNREELNPQHLWLFENKNLNNRKTFSIYKSNVAILKWKEYELPLDKVEYCCNILKSNDH